MDENPRESAAVGNGVLKRSGKPVDVIYFVLSMSSKLFYII
jgi:hypothetical protein